MNLEMCVTGNDCYGSGTRAILYPFCQVCEAMPTTKRVPKLLSCNRVKYLNFEKSRSSALEPESLRGIVLLPKMLVLKTSTFAVLVEGFQSGIINNNSNNSNISNSNINSNNNNNNTIIMAININFNIDISYSYSNKPEHPYKPKPNQHWFTSLERLEQVGGKTS